MMAFQRLIVIGQSIDLFEQNSSILETLWELDWLARSGIAFLAFLLVAFMAYFVVYPRVLSSTRVRVMPLTLYGRCTAGWILIMGLVVEFLFWRDFVREQGTFWGEYGIRLVVAVVFIALASGAAWLWNSE
jgi:hypothetical protein